ncbi:cell division protein FtsA [Buchnera aphidicola]|uniref:cell division protein FtsA n=1 Tax=Buchnera aphidicola TaxID=9 RepID=UPI00094BFAB9|nr:cell division protein FtsA [Buchnera aphidicola]
MNLPIKKNIIAGLEIGTTKIIVLIGEILDNETINIIGFGKSSSQGLEKGKINNLELLIKCINKSIHDAEVMANCQIYSVFLSASYQEIYCHNEIGITPIKHKEVTKQDIKTVIDTAASVKIDNDHSILHIIPQDFIIDRQFGIKNPIGLSGKRIQANVHIITCNKNINDNIIKAVKKCGVFIKKTIFSGLASSLALLTEEEKNSGVCLIDMGGETMNITMYSRGSLYHNIVIPYAGNTVTRDIAYAFSLSYSDAEFIKKKYGYAETNISISCQKLKIYNKKGKKIIHCDYDSLVEVINLRYTELLNLAKDEIMRTYSLNNFKNHEAQEPSTIVLTGGSSQVKYLSQCAKKIFHANIILKKPCNILTIPEYLSKPEYSTSIGLLCYGKNSYKRSLEKKKKYGPLEHLFKTIKRWLRTI